MLRLYRAERLQPSNVNIYPRLPTHSRLEMPRKARRIMPFFIYLMTLDFYFQCLLKALQLHVVTSEALFFHFRRDPRYLWRSPNVFKATITIERTTRAAQQVLASLLAVRLITHFTPV